MRSVRIGIDASRAAIVQRTGTEVYALQLVRRLPAISAADRVSAADRGAADCVGAAHHFCLYFNTPPPAGLIPCPANCEQRVMPFPRLWTHVRLSAEMAVRPPDVLFVPSHVLPLIHPRRSVVTVHDLGHHYYPDAHMPRQRAYLEWSTRYHVRQAARGRAHLLVDSQATEEDLVRIYGADPTRITVVHLGVDPACAPVRDPAALADARRKYGIPGPYLLYVGTLHPRKNLVRLIEAFAQILGSSDPDLYLVLAGKKGWLYGEIMGRIRALGLEQRVILPGFVEEKDLPALYSGARLFVMPSLYEGFCMPVLEAMACGAPVACSNVSSLPEVVGDAARLFVPHDVNRIAEAVAHVLDDRALRAELVARGFARARLFTWERCARQVLAVLERVSCEQATPRS
jgi:glycosyltransferase involved in cell wall biosynthesis